MGDGMGGGWNGRFWGTPILHLFVEKCCVFQGFGQKSGRPKNGRSNHHPSHPPLDVLLIECSPLIAHNCVVRENFEHSRIPSLSVE